MKEGVFYVMAFDSTHHAIKAEKLMVEGGFKVRTMPTPREITASCGLSIAFDEGKFQKIKEVITHHNLSIRGVYRVQKDGMKKRVERIESFIK